ncbi:MAG TPA: replication initiation factor domain-containing protein [Pseudogracilibacillus sp.]|nr:replication initiation factor domain-containing protein [Pseudogracilibacillus sp.]
MTKSLVLPGLKEQSEGKLDVIIDWIEFTVHNYNLSDTIVHLLELKEESFTKIPGGKNGYKNQKIWNEGNIFILYNDMPEYDRMGIHIIMSGTGCRFYEQKKNLREMMANVMAIEEHYKFTRIDIAIDDRSGELINFKKITKAEDEETISSLWYKTTYLREKRIADGIVLGRTLYFGSMKSKIFMRVYDKHLEQKKRLQHNKREDTTPLKEYVEWTRMEVVFREQRAQLLSRYLLETDDIGLLLKGTLKNYIRFLQKPKKSNDMRKRRWKTAPWYEKLLGDVEKLKLTVKPAEKSIEDMKEWINKQISPTIAAIMTANEGEIDWLYDLIINGSTRLKAKHKQAIAQYLSEKD